MIRTSAPGKLIISGEYAVLLGAPCLVVAIERRAKCELQNNDLWQFSSVGYSANTSQFEKADFDLQQPQEGDAGELAWHCYQAMTDSIEPAKMTFDTSAFYTEHTKYGFGSSAAMSVAICGALAQHSQRQLNFSTALKAHHNFQGGNGSGADVAAAYYGGCLRYQSGQAQTHALPDNLHWMSVWTGITANTKSHIQQFNDWRDQGNVAALDNLQAASENVVNADDFLEALKEYNRTLRDFDLATGLNIYTDAHNNLSDLAQALNVIYKPSGAGGGDLGILVSEDSERIADFSKQAIQLGFEMLPMPIAEQGLQIDL